MAMAFKSYQIASLVFFCYVVKCASWLDVVRIFPLNKNDKGSFLTTKEVPECSKDRQCLGTQFCSRHEAVCVNCRKASEMCRRNKMCCRGYECVSGRCKRVKELAKKGAFCKKDRDCEYGFCCTHQKGQSICKQMLEDGDLCNLHASDRKRYMSSYCPCPNGYTCKQSNISSSSIINILPDWRSRTFGRCGKIS